MREIKFKFWDPYRKKMDADHRDASIWNGLLVCEGDTIPLQYTGLTDKNGVEIYEADIISNGNVLTDGEDAQTCEVIWEDGMACFSSVTLPRHEERYYVPLDSWRVMRVIGNIYENPELLKTT